MTTETTTVYTVTNSGRDELRAYLETWCNHPVSDSTIRAYVEEIELSLTKSDGASSHAEIRASDSKSGNPIPFEISDDGWTAEEVEA